jgi:hypothetical protein
MYNVQPTGDKFPVFYCCFYRLHHNKQGWYLHTNDKALIKKPALNSLSYNSFFTNCSPFPYVFHSLFHYNKDMKRAFDKGWGHNVFCINYNDGRFYVCSVFLRLLCRDFKGEVWKELASCRSYYYSDFNV